MRKAFAIISLLFVLSCVLQFYFAAIGVFSEPEEELFTIHGMNGAIFLRLLGLLMLVFAAVAKAGKRTVWLSAIAFLLVLFQTVLFILTGILFGTSPDSHETVPLGATLLLGLHGLNGVAILLIGLVVLHRAWRLGFSRRGTAAPVAGVESSTHV
jgi:glucan phosphoethanolaminetransferase (alkaline phosphatase superfamily)